MSLRVAAAGALEDFDHHKLPRRRSKVGWTDKEAAVLVVRGKASTWYCTFGLEIVRLAVGACEATQSGIRACLLRTQRKRPVALAAPGRLEHAVLTALQPAAVVVLLGLVIAKMVF